MKVKQFKTEIKNKNIKELKTMLKEAEDVLSSLRLEKQQFKLKDLRSIFHKRQEIARILTEIKGKELTA